MNNTTDNSRKEKLREEWIEFRKKNEPYCGDPIFDFFWSKIEQREKEMLEEMNGLKTDERYVSAFGEWEARTYEEKMLVNAVIDSAKQIITNTGNK